MPPHARSPPPFQAHYKLDLSKPSDSAVAYKLLERVFVSAQESESSGSSLLDRWVNPTLDGKPFNLANWRRGLVAANGEWISGDRVKVSDARQAWRVPLSGLLEFDYETPNPQHVFTQHYRLDMGQPSHRAIAHDLRVRAALVPGDNWWNETLDGHPFSFTEGLEADLVSCATSDAWVLANHGQPHNL